jgi:hypothetical protein
MNVLGIVLTILVLVLIVMFLIYLFRDPYTLLSLQNGQNSSTIKASSLATNGSNIPSSNFAYSIWFYVNDFNYRFGEPKVIFGRMGSASSTNNGSLPGVNGLDPCPAVVLGAVENNLEISLGCFPGINQMPTTTGGKTVLHTCKVANVPIQRWVHIIVSVDGNVVDCYLDGKLLTSTQLTTLPTIYDSYSISLGSFDAYLTGFKYESKPLNPQQVWSNYMAGNGYAGGTFGVNVALTKDDAVVSQVSY